MIRLRVLVAVCLALVLIGTSGAMAVARGQMAAGPGQILVICVADGTAPLRVDADGNPIAPAHACPDCVLAGFAPTPETRALAAPVEMARAAVLLPARSGPWQPPRDTAHPPRAPPIPV
jgi:hypothetical protein